MRTFILGVILGSTLTGTLVVAGQFAPQSETQRQFDYFRERGQQLDIEALRRHADRQKIESMMTPCPK